MQPTVTRGMDRDAVSRELAMCLAPRLRAERDDYAVRLDTHLVDRDNAPAMRIEDNNIGAIQMLDRDHDLLLLCMTPVIREKTLLTAEIGVKRNVARYDDDSQLSATGR